MNKNKLDETNYTTQLAADINMYVKKCSNEKPQAAYTPHSTKQSFKNLNESSCFDLIYRITNSSLLILEVKVTHDNKRLHSFSPQQRRVDSVLRKFGIPLDYCYNLKSDYAKVNEEEYTLKYSLLAHPDKVASTSGIIQNQKQHVVLKDKIDYLLKKNPGNAGGLGALFTVGLLESIQEINTKLLFFSYNAGSIEMYTLEQMREIYESYKKHVHIAKGVDMNTASSEQLLKAFSENTQQLLKCLEQMQSSNEVDDKPSQDTTTFGMC
ncbi:MULTISPECIES: hypothetical protein [Vibrio]|uniref:DUF4263 domain-containing protein n=4 Tax=Vibrio harveyi group TaxID=717610 RepID=A0AAX1XG42_9VIBR|nr:MULTISPECIES: hypothetical protein [Vibrio]EGS6501174.1 hypothetical protein [Vibrio parahaemolyticus]ELF4880274.1 hypothetical protein [Vibrio parahaemolyticus]MCS0347617.1 hypothetical protein [Vibrio diabolicus]MCS0360460.1 hypothetical protein [Vibrio diabolicus]MCS0376522.1 hypothetical protein [Vibrio diabolicus]